MTNHDDLHSPGHKCRCTEEVRCKCIHDCKYYARNDAPTDHIPDSGKMIDDLREQVALLLKEYQFSSNMTPLVEGLADLIRHREQAAVRKVLERVKIDEQYWNWSEGTPTIEYFNLKIDAELAKLEERENNNE